MLRVRGKGFVCGYIYYPFALFLPRVAVPGEDSRHTMQQKVNPEITFKQYNSKIHDEKCIRSINNLSCRQQKNPSCKAFYFCHHASF